VVVYDNDETTDAYTDEYLMFPTGKYDAQTIAKIGELKQRVGLTVLMAEQNFHQAIRIADRGYIIVHGEIVFEGGVSALEQNELVKNYYLGTST
jgi:ABC-type branched-subunit amino acid transport system ATPase component